jgi:hypothetical protein
VEGADYLKRNGRKMCVIQVGSGGKKLKYLVYAAIFSVVSFLIGYNGYFKEDEMDRNLTLAYNVVITNIFLIVFIVTILIIERKRMKAATLITVVICILIAYLPYKIQDVWSKWEWQSRHEKEYTVQEVEKEFYDFPAGWRPPMQEIKVELENGHITVSTNYDEEVGKRIHADYDEPGFREDLLHYVDSEVSRLTDYTQFQYLTRIVTFREWQYRFERLPLKKDNGKPFISIEDNKLIQAMIQEHLVVEKVE